MGESQPKRRSIRLPSYDYTQPGGYFVTVTARGRMCVFGDISGGVMRPNRAGKIVQSCWEEIPHHFDWATLDAFVVMPNHVHGIIWLRADSDQAGKACLAPTFSGRRPGKPPARSLSSVVGAFKSAVTRKMNYLKETPRTPLWQRNYYEHVIRNEDDLLAIRRYILDNPLHWDEDRLNPVRKAISPPVNNSDHEG